ncbi:tRNA-uridine aminocarboxypropyltransferase [Rhodoferax saidenbachensis]|uniref:tRNA-uridine aminocarboxypropyltransferase n=1 Tax=Rhodoferax saidenbachensis TaxID=1484693 RepID=A0ABU1ZR74_9BURK|nr:tRNA-uridine aminocarboxypropyltransferase [Rhodoferax saidenbachensis]MDR7307051.1 DTW domain-containing protein YfiP [Rhodoferax saidenbachensis]
MPRPVCAGCLRPLATCICSFITPTASACEVLILQHPLEEHHAKNSARLLHLSLPGSRLVVGETFNDAALQALMPELQTTVLLYPPTDYEGHAAPALLDPAQLRDLQKLRLVVLDATWRKSRKMLHQSPALQRLPRLALDAVPAGRYAIRKAHAPGQLSTLEATCAALAQLEGDAARWQPLLEAFDGFVTQQQTYIPN